MLNKLYIYAIGGLVLVIVIGGLFLQNKNLRSEVKMLKGELQVSQDSVKVALDAQTKTAERMVKVQKVCDKAIKEYQRMLNECSVSSGPCQEVVVNGCPTITIVKDPVVDVLLRQLKEMWK